MRVSGTYPQPVFVNGYECNNCTDVELATKHIDPAHPQSGPFNINAAIDPTRHDVKAKRAAPPAVSVGGVLDISA